MFNTFDNGNFTDGTLGFCYGPDCVTPEGGSVPWWQTVLNQSVGLTSQIIGAYGHNPTQQIYPGYGPIGGGYNPTSQNQSIAQILAASQAQQYALQHGGTSGSGVGLDDAATSITSFITRNPLLVAGGVAALFLLFREPPRSRR